MFTFVRKEALKGYAHFKRIPLSPSFAGVWVSVLFLLASGCAPKQHTVTNELPVAPASVANRVWDAYQHAPTPFKSNAPFKMTTSLRYSTPDSGHRVVLRVWGNGGETVRFDLESGIGTLVARIRSGNDGFVAYSPAEKKALVHTRSNDALLRFGVPVPFSIRDLMNLLSGQYSAVFGKKYERATLVTGSALAYTLPPDKLGGTLVINENGLPVKWVGVSASNLQQASSLASTKEASSSWRIEFSRYTPEGLPGKIAFRYGNSHKAIFLYRASGVPKTPFSDKQLKLVLPPDTLIKPLGQVVGDN